MLKTSLLILDSTRKKAVTDWARAAGREGISFAIVSACVTVAALAAYYNSFGNSFQLDDFHIAVNNPWIRNLRNIPRFFIDPFTFSTLKANADYRPLLTATYALNYAISRYNPWSWHALSLALHITVALSLFSLGQTLFGRRRIVPLSWLSERDGDVISLGAAVLLALHPTSTAMVNYMSARSSLLVTALVLPATVLYLRAIHNRRSFDGIILPACLYVLAMLTKVEAISLLGVLYVAELLLSPHSDEDPSLQQARRYNTPPGKNVRGSTISGVRWLLPSRLGWRRLSPFLGLTVAYLTIRLILLPPGLNYAWGVPVFSHSTYLLTQFRVWWYYIGQLIAPVQMVADYGAYPVSYSFFDPRVIYALAGWSLVAALLFFAVRKAPVLAFLGLAYFIHLSPHSSFMPISEMVNEHRPYLPTTGLFLLVMLGIFLIVRNFFTRARAVFGVVVLILAIPLGIMTHDRNKIWKDEAAFWGDTVGKDPESTRAQMNYGLVLMGRGQYPEAESRFREAIRLSPYYNLAHINLGIVLAAQGQVENARQECDEAVRILPDDPVGYYWRGLFFSKQGNLAEAIADLQKAVALSTVPAKELEALADNLIRAGRMDEAREAIERGLALDPQTFKALREKVFLKGH